VPKLTYRIVAGLLLGAALASCAGPNRGRIDDPSEDLRTERTASGPDDEDHALTGEASYYGRRFHGRTTACGEPFDMYGFTAAHKTLPFHTVVRVIDPRTHKSVVVRINDRGPYADGRIIDLSWAAASDLGLTRHGVIPVKLEVLRWGDGSRVSN
jgi:rare lipoprotein A